MKVLKTRKKAHQTICIVEFSYGKKAPDSKETEDDVKLARNATRILNKLLDSVPCKKARVYTIQCVSKYHNMVKKVHGFTYSFQFYIIFFL